MTRADDTRAAGLVLALPPLVEALATVEEVLADPGLDGVDLFAVARRGRLIGGLTRRELQRTAAFGLSVLRLADLLVSGIREVAPGDSVARVREALHSGPAPFVVVRSAGRRPSGYIDRRRLARLASAADAWGAWPGSGAGRMRPALRKLLSGLALRTLEELGRRASRSGGRACLVGGVVRDLLLGRSTRDLDVIVEGQPRALLRGLGRESRYHARFLTATLVLTDGTEMDVAHARCERYPRPAALPQVEASTIERDLMRRDFTVNTLALSLEPRRFGACLDPFGAVEDLRQKKIRILHGLSFIDDPTRAFRAVRLAARLGFEVERHTAHSIEVALERGIFDRLSSTRLRRELEHLLRAPEFPLSLRLAARYGLLRALNRDLKPVPGVRYRFERAAEAIAWYEALERREPFQSWLVPLGLLLQGPGRDLTEPVLERLRPARRAIRVLRRSRPAIEALIEELSSRPRPSPSEVYFACRGLEVEILLMAAACAPRRGTRNAIRRHLLGQREIRLDISGRDLLRAGVPAGRGVARGLDAALAARLDGKAHGAAEQLRRALLGAGVRKGPA